MTTAPRRKDPHCPDCHGRSYDASGGDDAYHECQLCERPTERYHAWYRERWPEAYARWAPPLDDAFYILGQSADTPA